MVHPDYRWLILAMTFFVGVTCMGWIWLTLPVFIPMISGELGLGAASAQFLFGAISLSLILTALLGGRLGSFYSPRWTVGTGVLIVGLSTVLRWLSSGYYGLLGTSLLTGVGLGLVIPNLVHTLGIWFPGHELGFANGVRITGERTGAALAQGLLVGSLTAYFNGWRPVQVLLGASALTVGIAWIVLYRQPAGSSGNPPDPSDAPEPSPDLWAGFLESLADLFRDAEILVLALVVSVHSYCFFSYVGLLPTWLLKSPLLDEASVGLYGSVLFWALILGGLAIPTLTDRVADRTVILIPVTLVMGTGMLLTGFAGSGQILIGAISLTGLAAGGLIPLVFTLINERMDVGTSSQSAEAGFLLSVSQPGGVLGPPIGGYLFEHHGLIVSSLVVGVPILLVGAGLALWQVRRGA